MSKNLKVGLRKLKNLRKKKEEKKQKKKFKRIEFGELEGGQRACGCVNLDVGTQLEFIDIFFYSIVLFLFSRERERDSI